MKKITLLFLFIVNTLFLFSQQTSLVVFSQDGNQFRLVLNGILYNELPQTNVRITNLNPARYNARLLFENENIADLDADVNIREGKEMTYRIGRKVVSEGEKIALVKVQTIARDFGIIEEEKADAKMKEIKNKDVEYSLRLYSETTYTEGIASQNVINAKDMEIVDDNRTDTNSERVAVKDVAEDDAAEAMLAESSLPEKTSCENGFTPSQFEMVKMQLEESEFEDMKRAAAEELFNVHYFSTAEVKEILVLFTFEETRLELAKLAYYHSCDQENFPDIYELFDFNSSVEELKAFISQN